MEEQDIDIDIVWEDMNPTENKVYSEVSVVNDQLYPSLFEELKIRCNPANYLNQNYDYELSQIANDLYARILANENNIEKLMDLRKEAIKELNLHFSTAHIYSYLFEMTNPDRFTGITTSNDNLIYSMNSTDE